MVTIFSLTQAPTFELYMQQYMLRIDTQQTTCYDDIGLYAQVVDTMLGSILNTNGRTPMRSLNKKTNLHFGILQLLHLKSN